MLLQEIEGHVRALAGDDLPGERPQISRAGDEPAALVLEVLFERLVDLHLVVTRSEMCLPTATETYCRPQSLEPCRRGLSVAAHDLVGDRSDRDTPQCMDAKRAGFLADDEELSELTRTGPGRRDLALQLGLFLHVAADGTEHGRGAEADDEVFLPSFGKRRALNGGLSGRGDRGLDADLRHELARTRRERQLRRSCWRRSPPSASRRRRARRGRRSRRR